MIRSKKAVRQKRNQGRYFLLRVRHILHSPEYRAAFANDLKKMLPRLPLLDSAKDFWAFSKAGRALADLHINYETVPPYDGVTVTGADSGFFRVEKMRFPKKDGMVNGKKRKVRELEQAFIEKFAKKL